MTIEVDVLGRNMEISDQLYDYAAKKTGKLDRFLSDLQHAKVELTYHATARDAADRQVAQITLRSRRQTFRVEERADDVFAAIDVALDKLQRQIEKYKGKRSRRGDGTTLGDVVQAADEALDEPSEDLPTIVRRKQFALYPMDEMEAVEQMELLDHEDFFVFFNADSNSVNVLYLRRDGNYGLIETVLG